MLLEYSKIINDVGTSNLWSDGTKIRCPIHKRTQTLVAENPEMIHGLCRARRDGGNEASRDDVADGRSS